MDLYYEINGEGHPVVLIHSGGADLREWTFVAPLLAKNYKVVAFDGRGAGKSPSPVEYANYVEDLLELMDYLKLNQATIIGHNIGGQIATDFALLYPERVANLVLITPSLTGFHYSQEAEPYIKNIMDAAPNVDKMTEIFLSTPIYQVVTHSPQKDFAIQMLRHHFQRMLKWPPFKTIWPQPPAIDRLQELNSKTLFIIAQNDSADHYLIADHFRKIPKVKFIEIADADHIMVTLTHPEELYREINTFMEE
ncbi:hydrolase [Aneurinibacillus migulanus]|uniref:alpha/beta fold hydrolase n=1 Tax=Aneurinibacillus migulanus TaxID=47500 RepID=UPI0006B4EE88|nr:alpha/beta hydrolase [Aneurinibacillus migulanus]KPD09598.1 hydrolase [Aneurinibacillus migulanus]